MTYTGVHGELSKKTQEKLDKKFQKLAKLLDGKDGRGEQKAHVIVKQQRNQIKAEITLRFHDHQFFGAGAASDLSAALLAAVAKVEAQAVKHRDRFREKTRRSAGTKPISTGGKKTAVKAAKPAAKKTKPAKSTANAGGEVMRVENLGRRKPITLDEAVLEMEADIDYIAYRDASTDRLSVLIRRRDGNLDLIET